MAFCYSSQGTIHFCNAEESEQNHRQQKSSKGYIDLSTDRCLRALKVNEHKITLMSKWCTKNNWIIKYKKNLNIMSKKWKVDIRVDAYQNWI